MKKRLVAGLLAAGISAALISLPAHARCENARCTATKQIKNSTKALIARAFKDDTRRVKVKWATVSKSKKPAIVAKTKTVKIAKVKVAKAPVANTKVAKAKIGTVSKVHTALVNPETVKALPKTQSAPVRYTFIAPLRQQRAASAPAKEDTAPAKKTGGNSVIAMIESMAPQYGVPTWFALRIAKVESGYNPNARGSAGELGVFQMKCETARGIGYRGNCAGLLHPRTGVQYGLKHLSIALKSSRGNLKLAASKHNGGLGRKSLVPKYVAAVF